eukprot:TRINITY_DN1778_c0_g2_i1.p1 TRINITY_DN1778_c0_g2~~TRINITY_DN1778_c0_g2_i1.p1  ORF type:complete len:209 (+),score=-8.68 TRINITY_DN1778_c0_g2_i1:1058-1684(+)
MVAHQDKRSDFKFSDKPIVAQQRETSTVLFRPQRPRQAGQDTPKRLRRLDSRRSYDSKGHHPYRLMRQLNICKGQFQERKTNRSCPDRDHMEQIRYPILFELRIYISPRSIDLDIRVVAQSKDFGNLQPSYQRTQRHRLEKARSARPLVQVYSLSSRHLGLESNRFIHIGNGTLNKRPFSQHPQNKLVRLWMNYFPKKGTEGPITTKG